MQEEREHCTFLFPKTFVRKQKNLWKADFADKIDCLALYRPNIDFYYPFILPTADHVWKP